MPDEIKKPDEKQFEWVESKEGVHEIYGNFGARELDSRRCTISNRPVNPCEV